MKKIIFGLIAIMFSLSAFSHGPTPQKVQESVTIAASPQKTWDALKKELILIDGDDVYFEPQNGYSRGQQAIDFVERTREYAVLMDLASCNGAINQSVAASGI